MFHLTSKNSNFPFRGEDRDWRFPEINMVCFQVDSPSLDTMLLGSKSEERTRREYLADFALTTIQDLKENSITCVLRCSLHLPMAIVLATSKMDKDGVWSFWRKQITCGRWWHYLSHLSSLICRLASPCSTIGSVDDFFCSIGFVDGFFCSIACGLAFVVCWKWNSNILRLNLYRQRIWNREIYKQKKDKETNVYSCYGEDGWDVCLFSKTTEGKMNTMDEIGKDRVKWANQASQRSERSVAHFT